MKTYLILFAVLIGSVAGSCQSKMKADLILTNAIIYTVDPEFSVFTTIVIKDGLILDIGNQPLLQKYDCDDVQDMRNAVIYPGFIDGHCHFYGYGVNSSQANLVGTKSFQEVLDKLSAFAKENTDGWLIGRGWDQNDWENQEFPTNEELNIYFPHRPVYITRIDGHAAIANSAALKLAGIESEHDIEGGVVQVDDEGIPTGLLIDNGMDLVNQFIPERTSEQISQALIQAEKDCFAVGLTSVHDAGLSSVLISQIDEMHKSGKLLMNINAMLSSGDEKLDSVLNEGRYQTERLNLSSVKLYADGALGSRGALMVDDYSDDEHNHGLEVTNMDEVEEIVKKSLGNGFQVNTHCIGDAANKAIIDVYTQYLKPEADHRWRIEHVQVIHPEDQDRMAKFGIVPSVQAVHATSDMYWVEERLGTERVKYAYAYKDLLDKCGRIVNGSDFPVEYINPLFSFHAAFARQDAQNYPEKGFQMENAISRQDALRAMTIWPAWAAWEEEKKGSLEIGKVADLVIFQEDLMLMPKEEIRKAKVTATYSRGQLVFMDGC